MVTLLTPNDSVEWQTEGVTARPTSRQRYDHTTWSMTWSSHASRRFRFAKQNTRGVDSSRSLWPIRKWRHMMTHLQSLISSTIGVGGIRWDGGSLYSPSRNTLKTFNISHFCLHTIKLYSLRTTNFTRFNTYLLCSTALYIHDVQSPWQRTPCCWIVKSNTGSTIETRTTVST